MSSITAANNADRTNRWLLIGAITLAVIAGILIFAALNSLGSDDDSAPAVGVGETTVLVANQTINPNTKVTADMFDEVAITESALVPGALRDESSVVGLVTSSAILQGEQLSSRRLSLVEGKSDNSLASSIAPQTRGFSIEVNEADIVSGFVVPGDHVDIIATFKESRGGNGEGEITRVETILQDVIVLAVAQEPVASAPVLDSEGNPIPEEERATGRVDDLDPTPNARTISLQLTPQQVQLIAAARSDGDLSLALRPLGEAEPVPLDRTYLGDFGFIPPTPVSQ